MNHSASLLVWLDRHPFAYVWFAGGLIALALARAVGPLLWDEPAGTGRHDWWWGAVLLAILAAGRWPSLLLPRELNSDESQLLAGAHALTHDPVFWRSVIGGTAGPLDFFALWPAGWLCGWDSYLPARLTALALVAVSLTLAHQAMALILGRRIARVAGLGAVCFEALTNAPDFLHYSTELVPVTLLAVAAYAAVRRWNGPGGPGWSGLGGLALGAVPLAKLQAVPLAAVFGLCWLWQEFRTAGPAAARHRICLLSGALLPAGLFAGQLTVAGEWSSFVQCYWRYNLGYATGSSATGPLLQEFLNNSRSWDSLLHLWLPASAAWLVLMLRRQPVAGRALRIFGRAALAATVISLASILAPGRPFLHYWQLLVLPLGCLLGASAAALLASAPPAAQKNRRHLVAFATLGLVVLLLQHRARHPNAWVGTLAAEREHPHTALAERVLAHARPGGTIAIWGRTNHVYVETGLRQATRDAHIGALLEAGPLREYFRAAYLAEVRRARPDIFLDSVGPASLHHNSPRLAHDRDYPELAALIRAGYVLVEATGGARIYRRRDLVTP